MQNAQYLRKTYSYLDFAFGRSTLYSMYYIVAKISVEKMSKNEYVVQKYTLYVKLGI